MTSKNEKIIVAAIYLGTNYSGYAFSLKHEYKKDPTIVSKPTFISQSSLSVKVPTCVLCNPKGQFDSFGFDAEDKYSALTEYNEHHNWYFFRRFKMMLHKKQVDMKCQLEDEKGRTMPAIKVFAMAIRYFKDHFLNSFERCDKDLRMHKIQWVLPVPTTWTVSATDFLREAANEAGIDGSVLTIVQESKAIDLYIKLCLPNRCSSMNIFDDTKYIVTDIGDERIHTTVLEKKLDGAIKVVYTISDMSIGGTKINEAFAQMIINIIGAQAFKKFCDKNKDDHMELFRALNSKKRTASANNDSKIIIRLPNSLTEVYQEVSKCKVQDQIEQSLYKGKMIWINNKMRIDAVLFRSLFKNFVSEIKNHLSYVLQRKDTNGITTLIMSGSLSECPLLQETIKNAFPSIKVITTNREELVVLKGAVIFGHISTETTKEDEDDVCANDTANLSTCSSSYQQGISHDQTGKLKCKSLSEEGEDHLSSDYVEMSMQKQDECTTALKTKLENQMTLKTDVERAPSDDELFILSRKLDKFKKDWWLLAKLLGLSDDKIDEMEHGGGDSVRQYYKMLTAWKKQNAGKEKGSVGYLLRQCDEAGVDREVTVSVFRT